MNAETDIETDPFNETMVKGPGRMLAEAREEAGLTVEEVAGELRLEPKLITALETDDIAVLPEPTYVRGYIRAYSRLLDIDADLLLKRYTTMGHEDPEWEVHEQAKHEVAQGRSQKPITIVMILIIIGLLVNWLLTNDDEPETVIESPAATVSEPLVETTPEESAPGETMEELSAIELEYSASEPGLMEEPVISEEQESATGSSDAALEEQSSENELAGTAEAGAVAEDETVLREEDTIVLEFSADSWVQIFDADGKEALRGLFRDGAEKEVTGKAPFKVFLGFTPGVSVKFNGEPYDASQHTRRDSTSRFTLQAP